MARRRRILSMREMRCFPSPGKMLYAEKEKENYPT